MCVSVKASRLRECVEMMTEILGSLLLTDQKLTTPKEMGPGFREISLHSSSRTDKPLNLVLLGNWCTVLLHFACLRNLGRRLEPWEDPETYLQEPLREPFTKKSKKTARQHGAYITDHKE